MSQQREFDIIIWGASGFTGRLVAEYIFKTYGLNESLKWAMGGRNQSKLEQVRAAVADAAVPLVIADSQDEASLQAMVQRTKVICTTVGPYAQYGSKIGSGLRSSPNRLLRPDGGSAVDAAHDRCAARSGPGQRHQNCPHLRL